MIWTNLIVFVTLFISQPENLLLADKSRNAPTKLTDFGLAVHMDNGPNYFGKSFKLFMS